MKPASWGCCVIESNAVGLEESLRERTRVDAVALFLAHWRMSLLAVSLLTMAVLYVWGEYWPPHLKLVWCVAAFGNYLAQSFVSWKMETEESLVKAIPRYMPWLLFSITVSGVVWGSLPWLLSPPIPTVFAYVSLFNLMLVFCVVNSPCTRKMLICAVLPVMLLNTSALAFRSELIYSSYFLVVISLVLLYGLRVQAAIHTTMTERHLARDLNEALTQQQKQLVAVERENALLLERQRLMYDMHDGLGSTLLATLCAIERDNLPQSSVIEALRGCVDDLRLVIDSLEPMEHDLVTLLATVRYRLGPRLTDAGLTLDWDIHDLPELPWLEPPDALHVLRLVQEALANVLKHARADHVRLATRASEDHVEIHIEDNGCGFDLNTVPLGRGLRNQNRRAEYLGGEFKIDSALGRGTCLTLLLPVLRY
ncbi:sensor histidine kinase [Methylomonas sp. MS20]|uniref:sensor histidine kinase n=1 Tax=unclassified Methylomonas TaxID=2608980 RepID=UPI0028A42D81|nr:sensor histidine kinase [Methylomonas sp. MV1]MDT4332410.1 sensor histidine kinase [Methylomonas sp. MV1]